MMPSQNLLSAVGGGTISNYLFHVTLASPPPTSVRHIDSRHQTAVPPNGFSVLLTDHRPLLVPSPLDSVEPANGDSPPIPPSKCDDTRDIISYPLFFFFTRQMNFMEMWWLSVPFALVLCLILSWLSTGDDDGNYHESSIMRVSLREYPPNPLSRFARLSNHLL